MQTLVRSIRAVILSTISVLLYLGVACGQSDPAKEQANATQLFSKLAGSWACSGKFADGRPLASDIVMTLRLDGRALRYEHRDRAPNNFVQEAMWGLDTGNHQLVSLAFGGNSQRLLPQLFIAKSWTPSSATFEAQALTSPPFASNRFTYAIDEAESLKIAWEVQRNGIWNVGDEIRCNRK